MKVTNRLVPSVKVTNRLVVIAQSLPGPMEPRLWILIQAFAHLLPPGDVIDAGANDGAFLI